MDAQADPGTTRDDDLDRGAAVTRSLLGWGVVAGPFYVVVGLVLAFTRPGFDLTRHALSLLTLGHVGWLQRGNLVLTGLMVLAAAAGILRAIRNGRGLAVGTLVGVDGVALVLSAVFRPDPVDGFPPGARATGTTAGGTLHILFGAIGFPPGARATGTTAGGTLHILFGAIGFVAVAAAAFTFARWRRDLGAGRAPALVLGAVVLVGFVAGAALATRPVGIALLWVAVLAQWAWLAHASAEIYRWSPHPLRSLRAG